MNLVLLTHEREVERPSNTGVIALNAFPLWCSRSIWSRVRPDENLMAKLQSGQAAVLYPAPKDEWVNGTSYGTTDGTAHKDVLAANGLGEQGHNESTDTYVLELPETLVILDGTWQEARKMLRQSPYLRAANKYAISANTKSQYGLRRNQIEGGLCTLECIIHICQAQGLTDEASVLSDAFSVLNIKSE